MLVLCSIGSRCWSDPTHYQTVNSLFYTKPKRMHQDPNPQIAAEKNQWNHRALNFLQPASRTSKAKLSLALPDPSALAAKKGQKSKTTKAIEPKWA